MEFQILDVDYVKIDGSFIDSMHTDEMNLALVKAINDVCHILGKMTIAEYVQNEDAMGLLREIGVDYAQGYNIAVAADYDQQTIQFRIAWMISIGVKFLTLMFACLIQKTFPTDQYAVRHIDR